MKNSYLITGGTGSFGNAFVKQLLFSKKNISRLIIFSRDELKQSEMAMQYPIKKFPFIRFFLGDVRDVDRLNFALDGIENVIHAAALKQVPSTEYNPFEAIQTNIFGAQNLIKACLNNNVKKVVALSTDKACSPVNLYGATKLCSDKLFVSANNIKGQKNIKFSVVRYGNVFGSRGSVYQVFRNLKNSKFFPITHKDMTRFNISLNSGVSLVLWALEKAYGGEIIVPKLRSFKILDLAKAMDNKKKIQYIGIRAGEKIHEQMISSSDSYNTIEMNNSYVIINPEFEGLKNFYLNKKNTKYVKEEFRYSSGNNGKFLDIKDLKKIIKEFELNQL